MKAPARIARPSILAFLTAALAAAAPAAAQTRTTATAPSVTANADVEIDAAEDTATPLALTLAQVVARARQDPPAVLQAMASARSAESQESLVRAALLPTVSVSFGASGSLSNSPSSNVVQTSPLALGASTDASVNLRWTIWDFGRTDLASQGASANARAARNDVRSAERAAVAQAAAAYYTLLADGEVVNAFRTTVQQRERQEEIARRLVAAGTRAPIEQTRAALSLAAARLDVTTAETTAQTDAATLALALGMDPAEAISAVPPAATFVVDADARRAADAAVRSRPEVAAARDRLAAATSQLAVAGAAYRPSLTLNAAAGAGAVAYANGNVGARESGSVGIGLSFPLFDPTISANRSVADASVSRARAALDAQVLAVRADAVQAAAQVRTARQAVAQAEQLTALATANLSQAQGRYEAGSAQLLELVDAQSADQNARIALIRARFQLELAQVRLLASQGRIDDLAGRA